MYLIQLHNIIITIKNEHKVYSCNFTKKIYLHTCNKNYNHFDYITDLPNKIMQ